MIEKKLQVNSDLTIVLLNNRKISGHSPSKMQSMFSRRDWVHNCGLFRVCGLLECLGPGYWIPALACHRHFHRVQITRIQIDKMEHFLEPEKLKK